MSEEFGETMLLALIVAAWIVVIGLVFLSALWIGLL